MKKIVKKLFEEADIKINGNRQWDIQVHNNKFFNRVFLRGSIAVGESYVDGWWDSQAIDQLIYKGLKAKLDLKLKSLPDYFNYFKAKFTNNQRKSKALNNAIYHYDLGNDLFKIFLDRGMNYSCGYWKNAKNLNEAQKAKLDLVCRKLKLSQGMKILEIGCGWGNFAYYAAKKCKVKVVAVTISKEQTKYAKERCKGLDVEIRHQDYRDINQEFDRVASIAMFEAVGYKNYRTFMKIVDRCLKNDGLFLLHTIGESVSTFSNDPWLEKYIFPGSMAPSASQLTKAAEGIFTIEDWHNFGRDYDKTLLEWHKRFNENWNKIKDKYSERFFRMWNFYLLCCAATFRARRMHLWQIVFSKNRSDIEYHGIC